MCHSHPVEKHEFLALTRVLDVLLSCYEETKRLLEISVTRKDATPATIQCPLPLEILDQCEAVLSCLAASFRTHLEHSNALCPTDEQASIINKYAERFSQAVD